VSRVWVSHSELSVESARHICWLVATEGYKSEITKQKNRAWTHIDEVVFRNRHYILCLIYDAIIIILLAVPVILWNSKDSSWFGIVFTALPPPPAAQTRTRVPTHMHTHACTYPRARTHMHRNMSFFLHFHGNNGYANAPRYYVIRTCLSWSVGPPVWFLAGAVHLFLVGTVSTGPGVGQPAGLLSGVKAVGTRSWPCWV
jgi:hypothetical protein